MPELTRGTLTTRTRPCGCHADLGPAADGEDRSMRFHDACDEAKRLRAAMREASDRAWDAWFQGRQDADGGAPAELAEAYQAARRAYLAHFGEDQ